MTALAPINVTAALTFQDWDSTEFLPVSQQKLVVPATPRPAFLINYKYN